MNEEFERLEAEGLPEKLDGIDEIGLDPMDFLTEETKVRLAAWRRGELVYTGQYEHHTRETGVFHETVEEMMVRLWTSGSPLCSLLACARTKFGLAMNLQSVALELLRLGCRVPDLSGLKKSEIMKLTMPGVELGDLSERVTF